MDIDNPTIFYSGHVRIARAKEHLKDLATEIDRFFNKNPYVQVSEPDSDGIHEIHKIKFKKRFPFRWRILATEVIEHARASLDHATFAAHLAARGHPDSRYVAFPFGKTATDLDRSVRGRSKDLVPEIQTLLRSFNCYDGGNAALNSLNELCNVSKHALIAFMVGVTSEVTIEGSGLFTAQPQFPEVIRWDRAKNEIRYARTKRGTDFEHQGNMTVFVAIQDRDATSLVAAVAVLNTMVDEAERVIMAIESECCRIGLIT